MFQQTFLIGHLGATPQIRILKDGATRCTTFSLAVNTRRCRSQPETLPQWFTICVWSGLAPAAARYLSAGDRVFVAGRVRANAYLDTDGRPQARLVVDTDLLVFLSPLRARHFVPTDAALTIEAELRQLLPDLPPGVPLAFRDSPARFPITHGTPHSTRAS